MVAYNLSAQSVDLKRGLVAYYPFNGNANDESGNGNNGSVYGATLTNDKNGNSNKAYNFDGINDYIQISDNYSLRITENLTLAAWIYPTSTKADRKIITKFPSDAYQLAIEDGDAYIAFHNGSKWNITKKSSDININQWSLIVGVYDYSNSQLIIYINGKKSKSTYQSTKISSSNAPLVIGNFYNGFSYFQGKIDEVRVYNRALNEKEIQTLYSGTTEEVVSSQSNNNTISKNTNEKPDISKLGKPTIVFDNGDKRWGEKTGSGIYAFKNGTIYEGDFVDGNFHGKGTHFSSNGSKYIGDFVDDKRTGKGKYYESNGQLFYEGDYVGGSMTGKGKMYNSSGQLVYEGDVVNGSMTGKGKYYESNGQLFYEGDYVGGSMTGKGKMYNSSGQLVYEGDFVNGSITGKGKWYYGNGYYIGGFYDGKKSGYGEYYWNDGSVHKGNWSNNNREGTGTVYKNGNIFAQGTWSNDKLVQNSARNDRGERLTENQALGLAAFMVIGGIAAIMNSGGSSDAKKLICNYRDNGECVTCNGRGSCLKCNGRGENRCDYHDTNKDGKCTSCNSAFGMKKCYECNNGVCRCCYGRGKK